MLPTEDDDLKDEGRLSGAVPPTEDLDEEPVPKGSELPADDAEDALPD